MPSAWLLIGLGAAVLLGVAALLAYIRGRLDGASIAGANTARAEVERQKETVRVQKEVDAEVARGRDPCITDKRLRDGSF